MRQRSEVMMSLPGLADACPNSRPRHVLITMITKTTMATKVPWKFLRDHRVIVPFVREPSAVSIDSGAQAAAIHVRGCHDRQT